MTTNPGQICAPWSTLIAIGYIAMMCVINAGRLKTLTLSLEVFIRLVHTMDTGYEYNLQLFMLFHALSSSSNMEVDLRREALQLYPEGHYLHTAMLEHLATTIAFRFRQEIDSEDPSNAPTIEILSHFDHDPPHLDADILGLARLLSDRFSDLNDLRDLEDSIKFYRLTLQRGSAQPLDDNERGRIIFELANALQDYFHSTPSKDMAILEQSYEYFLQCKHLLSLNHADFEMLSAQLVSGLVLRYSRTRDPAYLEEANPYMVDTLTRYRTPDLIPILFDYLRFLKCWEEVRNASHLDLAIECMEEIIPQLTGKTSSEKPMVLMLLADTYWFRFETFSGADDLDRYISYTEDALHHWAPGNSGNPDYMISVSVAYKRRYQHLKALQDLQDAIKYGRSAIEHIAPGSSDPGVFSNIAYLLRLKFSQTLDISTLDEAIGFSRKTVEMTCLAEPLERTPHITTLASALSNRFRETRSMADLDEAIQYSREVLMILPSGSSEARTAGGKLAELLMLRYTELEQHDGDIEEAIVLLDLADQNNKNNKNDPIYLRRIAQISWVICPKLSDPPKYLLDYLVNFAEQEFKGCSREDRPTGLHNLVQTLQRRGGLLENIDDINRAIELSRESMTSSDYLRGNSPLYDYASSILTRFNLQSDAADLDEAVSVLHVASSNLPEHDPRRAQYADALAEAYISRSKALQQPSDFDEAMILCEKAVNSSIFSLKERLKVAIRWTAYAHAEFHKSALNAYTSALSLSNRHIMASRTVESQQERLAETKSRLPQRAASWAMSEGQLETAVEFLEQGRAIVWSQVGRYRTPLDHLSETNPSLAAEFRRISALLEEDAVLYSSEYDPPTYRSHSQQWEAVLETIRAEEGFSDFLKQTPFKVLQKAAVNGPVVIINIDASRSDAIIVQFDHPPVSISVPDATPDAIDSLAADLSAALNTLHVNQEQSTDNPRIRRVIASTLQRLWNILVEPVVEVLSSTCGMIQGSRVWWCPIGTLWSLPIHAAGQYTAGGRNLPDLFVSSYTPTLSALLQSTKNCPDDATQNTPNILVVGQAETPGQTLLPSVLEEIQSVKEFCTSTHILEGPGATRHSVTCGLQQCSWAHFACHGKQDIARPFNSHFVLHNEALSLLDIVRIGVLNADFAFLSACHSAAGDRKTPNEAISLASGLHFSGFKSVVGTMWAMADIDGPVVAREFYRYMLRSPERADHRDAAVALNHATKALRRMKVPLERWINFVHVGA